MQDLIHTISEYEESRAKIQERIQHLNAQISSRTPHGENFSLKSLLERRGILYTQLWDLEYAIREMGGYVRAITTTEVNQKVG